MLISIKETSEFDSLVTLFLSLFTVNYEENPIYVFPEKKTARPQS